MRRFKTILGIAWAAAAIPIVLAGFIGSDSLGARAVTATGIRVSPWYTGGDSLRCEDHGGWRTVIHREVTRGLLGERPEGFVQVDFKPDGDSSLPVQIDAEIDLDGEGSADVRVRLDTRKNTVELIALDRGSVGPARIATASRSRGNWSGVGEVIDMGRWRVLRIGIRNPRRG
jgi:hypothetical protein